MRKSRENHWDIEGNLLNESPNENIGYIRQNVDVFLEDVLREDASILIEVGRKTSYLLRHRNLQIVDEGFQIALLRHMRDATGYFPSKFSTGLPVIIIVDSINSGTEMVKVLQHLSTCGVVINKVYSYLIREEGKERLINSGLITPDQLQCKFKDLSSIEYLEHQARLQAYFRTRLTPLEPERIFVICSADREINFRQMSRICNKIFSDSLGTKVRFQRKSKNTLPSDIWYMTSAEHNVDAFRNILDNYVVSNLEYDLYGIAINFKLQKTRGCSYFSLSVDCEIECNILKENPKILCPLKEMKECIFNKERKNLRNIGCGMCLNQTLSSKIIMSVLNPIILKLKERGINCQLVNPSYLKADSTQYFI